MILGLTSLSDPNIQRILEEPRLIWTALGDPDLGDPQAVTRRSRLSRLFRRRRPAPGPSTLPLVPGEGERMDLDVAWHAIHFLLTGSAWEGSPPLDFLLRGGQPTVDVGYEPARVATARELRDFGEALDAVSMGTLKERFDPSAFDAHEIYPEGWSCEQWTFIESHLIRLRAFVASTVAGGLGTILTMT